MCALCICLNIRRQWPRSESHKCFRFIFHCYVHKIICDVWSMLQMKSEKEKKKLAEKMYFHNIYYFLTACFISINKHFHQYTCAKVFFFFILYRLIANCKCVFFRVFTVYVRKIHLLLVVRYMYICIYKYNANEFSFHCALQGASNRKK